MDSNFWNQIFTLRAEVDRVIDKTLGQHGIQKSFLPTIAKTVTPEHYTDSFSVVSDVSDEKYYLQPSPEFYLKKLIAETQRSFYYLGPVYRAAEDMNTNIHLPEFQMLEWYKIGSSIKEFENLSCELILDIVNAVIERGYFQSELPKVQRVTWEMLFNSVGLT